jgi:hypothetical protein
MLLRKRKRSEHKHHYPQPDPTFHINLPGNNLTDRWMRLCWTGQERRIRVSRNSFIVRKKNSAGLATLSAHFSRKTPVF